VITMPHTATTPDVSSTDAVPQPEAERIVFFDGECGLCNHTVDFLLRKDVNGILMFAPLQGSTATEIVPADVRIQLDTLVYYRSGQLYYRSAAVVRFLRDLGGFWGIAGTLLWLIPGPLRDIGYRSISALRYRLFGKHEACRIPTPAEQARFLD
jgi:predicted DCC family thiol-disulfide oxidoreductase YuxK